MSRAWRLGLAGRPVAHSLSPVIASAAFAELGLQGDYRLFDVDEDGLERLIAALGAGELDGLNVTIPHKLRAAKGCGRLSDAAAVLGVANTLVRESDGVVVGHNTDVGGLFDAMTACLGQDRAARRKVCVLGAGGAAYAAVLAADLAGAAVITVTNRTPERAETLLARLDGAVSAQLEIESDPVKAASEATLLLQATSIGMACSVGSASWKHHRASADRILAAMADGAALYDLVYRPAVTPFVEAARARDMDAASGLGMLVGQAARAFELWTGRLPPREPLTRAASDALGPD